jgi:hypothetical protein
MKYYDINGLIDCLAANGIDWQQINAVLSGFELDPVTEEVVTEFELSQEVF